MENLSKNDRNLAIDFYKNYTPDHWAYKTAFLKNTHDNFNDIEKILCNSLVSTNINSENYKKILRLEMFFLYFQMIEALFHWIFSVSMFDDLEIWSALSFGNKKKSKYNINLYNKIKEFSETILIEPNLKKMIQIKEGIYISSLQKVFYSCFCLNVSNEEMKKNLEHIQSLLQVFAKDFCSRGGYNAYKHGLHFVHSPLSIELFIEGNNTSIPIIETNDSIIYLIQKERIYSQQETFDFEYNYLCCSYIHKMISNIFFSRKQIYVLKSDSNFDLFSFTDDTFDRIMKKRNKTVFKREIDS